MIQGGKFVKFFSFEGCVCLEGTAVAFELDFSGGGDEGSHVCGLCSVGLAGELFVRYAWDFDMDIDAVDEGARDFGEVFFHLAL